MSTKERVKMCSSYMESNVQDCTQLRKLQKLRKIVKFVVPQKNGSKYKSKGIKDTAENCENYKNCENCENYKNCKK